MIKQISPQERQADNLADIKACLETASAPIYSNSIRSEYLGELENTLRGMTQLNQCEIPTQIQSFLLELLEFMPRFEKCCKSGSREMCKLATIELKSRMKRVFDSLSDEIDELNCHRE